MVKIKERSYDHSVLLDELVSDEVLQRILLARGIKHKEQLDTSLKNLEHFASLKDIDKASQLVAAAIKNNDMIGVAGDYDVDGMSGTALGIMGLKELGARKVCFYVPSRYDDGYGLSDSAIYYFKEQNTKLIITVDNGISCFEPIELAKSLDLQVVITDHHECQETLPIADAIINPKQPDCNFPSKNLSGVGVLFYLLIATRSMLVAQNFYGEQKPNLGKFLDLVALGTVGDMVPLDLNNRRLVNAGLNRIKQGNLQTGLKALALITKSNLQKVTSNTFAFDLCPRLNAATRLKLERNIALECLLESDFTKAVQLAKQLEYCNQRRTDYEKVMLADAMNMLYENKLEHSAVLYKDNFLEGVVGLIANRIKDTINQPTFVFAKHGNLLTGSGRSVAGVSLAAILQEISLENPLLLERFGGHAMAAGLSIKEENLAIFAKAFDSKVEQCLANVQDEVIYTDGQLPLDRYNLNFAYKLNEYGPYGNGFEEPSFDGTFIVENSIVLKNVHVKFRLKNEDGEINAILFRASKSQMQIKRGTQVRIVYNLNINSYHGSDQLVAKILYLSC